MSQSIYNIVINVITYVILASITVSITVENTEKSYPSPVAINIVFGMAVILAIASVTEATCYQDGTVNS
jgi:hypothetical protein